MSTSTLWLSDAEVAKWSATIEAIYAARMRNCEQRTSVPADQPAPTSHRKARSVQQKVMA